jgi:tetratricopeptide (TPR) repeat protein
MEEKLDFSLPGKKSKSPVTGKIAIFLLLLLLVLGVLNLMRKPLPPGPSGSATGSQLSVEQTKDLALKLAQRSLYARAAKVWQDYLAAAALGDAEQAKALFQVGTLLEKAGQLEEAIEYYYRSENAAKLDELSGQINTHIKDCFEKLGKFSALRYELMDRTSMAGSAQAGAKVVAEIGPEKITEADLDAIIESNIDNQLGPMAAFMTAEQLNEQKAKMLEQFQSSQAKNQFLQSWLAQEILYRQALKDGLSEEKQVKRLLDDLARGVLSQEMMSRELAAKISITETDLQTYYTANKDKYIEPANEDEGTVERQKTFDEVRQQVLSELLGQKRQDIQAEYINRMMDEYNVIIHTSVPAPAGETEE